MTAIFIVSPAGQAEAVELEEPVTPGGPEWWTEANTARWQAEVWGGSVESGEAQRTWGHKYGHGEHITKGKFPPPTVKQYREWAKGETRPRCMTFYDGKEMTS